MYKYDKTYYMSLSEKTGFQKDILEKVHRLTIVLEYINNHAEIGNLLVLKGGTAINLSVFNLPRLSVDIDMDLNIIATREEMMNIRIKINNVLLKYFNKENYKLMPKSKNHHSLDSWILSYTNNSGNSDKLKVGKRQITHTF